MQWQVGLLKSSSILSGSVAVLLVGLVGQGRAKGEMVGVNDRLVNVLGWHWVILALDVVSILWP